MKTITYFETRTTTIMSNSNVRDPFTCELANALHIDYLTKEEAIKRFLFNHQNNPDADSECYDFGSDFFGDCSDFEKAGYEKWKMTDSVKNIITLSDEDYAKLLDELETDDVYNIDDNGCVMDRVIAIEDFLDELDYDSYTVESEPIEGNLIAKLGELYDEYFDYLAGDDEE